MSRGAAGSRAPTKFGDRGLGRVGPSACAWSAIRRVLVVAAPLMLAACMVGPDFTSADAPVAEQWLEAGNPSVKTDRQDYEQWWNAFNDPTLNNLIDRAYRQNLTLMA